MLPLVLISLIIKENEFSFNIKKNGFSFFFFKENDFYYYYYKKKNLLNIPQKMFQVTLD